MPTHKVLLFIAVLFASSYLPRMIPLVLLRRRITNPHIRSFLIHMPYAILGAMIFPDIFFSTASFWSALAGGAVACTLSFRRKGLLPVALAAVATVLIVEKLLPLLPLS